jgi:lipid A 3-O-deacylase
LDHGAEQVRAITIITVALMLAAGQARAQDAAPRIHAGEGLAGIFSEVRGGALAHGIGGRESGANLNAELLFVSPVPARLSEGLDPRYRWVFEPRPHLGVSANTGGYTSRGYFGLTWTAMLARDVVRPGDAIRFDWLFGGSVNDGKHSTTLPDRASLGGNLLFHLGAELGYQFDRTWSVSVMFEHDSNGGLAHRNQGLNGAGMRLGYAL